MMSLRKICQPILTTSICAIQRIRICRLFKSTLERFRVPDFFHCSFFDKVIFRLLKEIHHIEIARTMQIGEDSYIGHAYNITINPKAMLGRKYKHTSWCYYWTNKSGVGRRGAPAIGNEVWIGINAAIVGNVTIGDDVLIAPNSYVNCDVPSHSIVFGNPCIIKHRDSATEGYINRRV